MAEALAPVPDPLLTALHPGPPAPAPAVAAALAGGVAPAEAAMPAPGWLRPEQQRPFRRVVAAIARHRGALLALDVGTGKTYVALAAAAALNGTRRETTCLVPATLAPQWREVAARLGVPVTVATHEQASRGRLPERPRGVVLIDESHRFRNPGTRRYRNVAPWLVGRPAVLITATPIVNRLDDLAHQLHLALRDDALAMEGLPSLGAIARGGHPALASVVVTGLGGEAGRPTRIARRELAPEHAAQRRLLAEMDRLDFSVAAPVARLVRGVFWRALASSPAALASCARRYARLLLHARDASAAGRPRSRRDLLRLTAGLDDQLVWWELMPRGEPSAELALEELPAVLRLSEHAEEAAAGEDPKANRLRSLLRDDRRTVVFVSAVATVRHLRERLGGSSVAWCTGERAGIGRMALSRADVLALFRPGALDDPRSPRVLVATDVAAEGLDLQRAERIVHYDLPWTPMRLAQREGRALRLGSAHAAVETIRFDPPAELERRLRQHRILRGKAALPARAGLSDEEGRLWRWREEAARRFAGCVPVNGVARVPGGRPGVLAGYAMRAAREPGGEADLARELVWIGEGGWSHDPGLIVAALERAAAERGVAAGEPELVSAALARLLPAIRERFAVVRGRRWQRTRVQPGHAALLARLQRLTAEETRARNAAAVSRAERALRVASGGHTAGEAMRIAGLADATDAELVAGLARLPPPDPPWGAVEVRLIGLLLFGGPGGRRPEAGAAPSAGEGDMIETDAGPYRGTTAAELEVLGMDDPAAHGRKLLAEPEDAAEEVLRQSGGGHPDAGLESGVQIGVLQLEHRFPEGPGHGRAPPGSGATIRPVRG